MGIQHDGEHIVQMFGEKGAPRVKKKSSGKKHTMCYNTYFINYQKCFHVLFIKPMRPVEQVFILQMRKLA
jgi:hypothetical protein